MSVTCSEPCNSGLSNTDGLKPHCMFPPDSFPATLPSDSPAPVILANFLSLKHSKEDAIARLMPVQNSTWKSPPLGIHRTLTSYKCLPKCHLFGENLPDHPVSHHTPSSFLHLIFLVARHSNWPCIICLPTVCLPHWSINSPAGVGREWIVHLCPQNLEKCLCSKWCTVVEWRNEQKLVF